MENPPKAMTRSRSRISLRCVLYGMRGVHPGIWHQIGVWGRLIQVIKCLATLLLLLIPITIPRITLYIPCHPRTTQPSSWLNNHILVLSLPLCHFPNLFAEEYIQTLWDYKDTQGSNVHLLAESPPVCYFPSCSYRLRLEVSYVNNNNLYLYSHHYHSNPNSQNKETSRFL